MRRHRDGRPRSPLGSAATLVLAVASASSWLAGRAVADSGAEAFDRSGPYLGLSGVYALESFDDSEFKFDDSAGVNLRFGYRAFPNLSFELAYEWLEGFDSTSGPVGEGEREYDTHLITANAKILGMNGRYQPYALVGGGVLVVNIEHVGELPKPWVVYAGFAARFGGGVDVYLSRHFAINLEGTYVVPAARVKDQQYGTLGLGFQYRF